MSQKILIVSDSHGSDRYLRKAIENMGGHIDLMIHLGDSEVNPEQISRLVSCPVEMVRGNSDGISKLPMSKLIDIGEHRALLTHGHQYGGRFGIPRMRETAKENGADIVMFGHIHEPVVEQEDGITVLNPGSISRPRQDGHRPTYLVMTIEEDGRTEYVPVYL